MSIIRYEPWNRLGRLHDEINQLFDTREHSGKNYWRPSVDIQEEEQRYVLRADLPGVNRDDIEITMDDGILTVSGKRKKEELAESDGFRRIERFSGEFLRRFSLPETVDSDAVTAESRDGVLEIVIPKVAKAQPRRITIQAA